jgi:threonine synthase
VLPSEFKGLLERERRIVEVDEASVEKVKRVVESVAARSEGKNVAV